MSTRRFNATRTTHAVAAVAVAAIVAAAVAAIVAAAIVAAVLAATVMPRGGLLSRGELYGLRRLW